MFLSKRIKKKVQDYELQVNKFRNEVKRLEHNLFELCREHEEEKRAAHEQSLKIPNGFSHEHELCKDEELEPYPIYDSYEVEEECEVPLVLFPHEQGLNCEGILGEGQPKISKDPSATSCHNLFIEVPFNLEHYELFDEPIFDTYELEEEDLNSLCADKKEWTAAVHKEPSMASFGMKDNQHLGLNLTSPLATPNGMSHTYSSFALAIHDQSILGESFMVPMSTSSSLRNSEHSKESRLKNCYMFKRKGVHSDLHDTPAFGAQTEVNGKAHVLIFLDFYGRGLLDYHIEDDELKDQVSYVIDCLSSNADHPSNILLC